MYRIDEASANIVKPLRDPDGPKPDAFFDDAAGTIVTGDFLNAVQEELINVLIQAGITPDKGNDTQLYQALVNMGLRAATTLVAGVAELATNAETQAGTDTARVVTPASLQSKVATDTAKGIVELATNAEVIAGADTTRAVTPAGMKSAGLKGIDTPVVNNLTINNGTFAAAWQTVQLDPSAKFAFVQFGLHSILGANSGNNFMGAYARKFGLAGDAGDAWLVTVAGPDDGASTSNKTSVSGAIVECDASGRIQIYGYKTGVGVVQVQAFYKILAWW